VPPIHDTAPQSVPDDSPGTAGDAIATRRLVVALDGPASSGKSSVGAAAAREVGYRFVDTGLLYRALTALVLRRRIPLDQGTRIAALVEKVALAPDPNGRFTRVLLEGEDATDEARGREVDAAVSAVSRLPEVRAALLPRQRALAAEGGIVVAGRDIGTVVLPGAHLKVFLDASVEERADRRIAELGLEPASPEAAEVRDALRRRDELDRTRAVAPLRPADDARVLHTDGNTFAQTVALVVAAIRDAAPQSGTRPAAGLAPPAAPVGASRPASAVAAARAGQVEAPTPFPNDKSLLIRMIALVSRIGARLVADVRFVGLEHIPRDGAVVLCANHISNGDPMICGAWITPILRRRRIHWLSKRELFDWPIFGWIAHRGGAHPVDRSTADVEAFRVASRILEAGQVIMIFPEGTRSPTGALQEAKDGLAALAIRTGATIVPIGINGSDLAWPRGQLPRPWPRRRVEVRVGAPFKVADLAIDATDRRAAKTAVTRAVMGRIAALLDPRHRGMYADAVDPGADGRR
jgi:cytidylate kinase